MSYHWSQTIAHHWRDTRIPVDRAAAHAAVDRSEEATDEYEPSHADLHRSVDMVADVIEEKLDPWPDAYAFTIGPIQIWTVNNDTDFWADLWSLDSYTSALFELGFDCLLDDTIPSSKSHTL